MTRWMAVSEFKALGFCLIHQIQSILRFPCELSLLTTGHSARSEAKSQNLIVILRETKRSLRIYCRTDDGFCNSGQRCPPCRMTWWMAHNEFKNPKFCEIQQLPKEYRYSYKLYCWHRHSTRSKVESQNLIIILREVKRTPRIYWRTNDGFCNSGQWTSFVQNDRMKVLGPIL